MRVGLNPMTGVLIRRRKFGQEHAEPKPCNDGGRDRSQIHQKLERNKEGPSLRVCRESISWRHLDLGF